MGLFDFFKSKEEKEKEDLMLKLKQQVFPGGIDQIERETIEVRKLLDFKYSLAEVRQTYIHAAAMFFISQDKSQQRIITSILHNAESVVTKEDAIKIFNYLSVRNKPNSVFEEISQTINSLNDSIKLFFVAKGGIVELKRYRDLNNEGKFEVILFNSVIVLNYYQRKYPKQYSEIEEEYFKSLFNEVNNFKLSFANDEIMDFINARLRFYTNEINLLQRDGLYMPAKIYNAFYENPFIKEPEVSMDIMEVMTFYEGLTNMMKWVHESLNKI
jgi:hypothetical protein